MTRRIALAFLLFAATAAFGADITVMYSGGLSPVVEKTKVNFEAESGHKLVLVRGASMGESPQAIPVRLARGEPADVLVMAGDAFDEMVKRGHGAAGSRVDVANSSIAMGVKAGNPKPDISSVEALKKALLEAPKVAISRSASGVYLETELYPRLGIAEQMKPKTVKATDELVGHVLLRGEAPIGFQQLSEIRAVPGIEFAAMLPAGAQRVTVFSAGLAAKAVQREAAKAYLDFLGSIKVREAIDAAGLEPPTR